MQNNGGGQHDSASSKTECGKWRAEWRQLRVQATGELCNNWNGRGVTGVALSVLGQECHRLTELDLSACRHAANWALEALFCGCPRLTALDLSHCPKLTDHDVRVMSSACHGLRTLALRECRQVSDEGVLEVAKACAALERLDLERSELPFKMTDVALLSVAERCAMVVELNLNGCEMITGAPRRALFWGKGGQVTPP